VVIANAYPIDVSLTFMRSKGLIPLLLARPGASRLLVSACSEGVGHRGLFPFVDAPPWQRPLHLARSRRGGPATATARRPNWLYAPGRDPADLPAETPGMTVVAAWQDALARVNQEQDGRRNLEVVVYPCALLQVLGPAGQPAAA
jgi:hypothetical protein